VRINSEDLKENLTNIFNNLFIRNPQILDVDEKLIEKMIEIIKVEEEQEWKRTILTEIIINLLDKVNLNKSLEEKRFFQAVKKNYSSFVKIFEKENLKVSIFLINVLKIKLRCLPSDIELLDQTTESYYKKLIDIFFSSKNNNIFHNLFTDLIFTIIYSDKQELLELIFEKLDFLPKIMRIYNDEENFYSYRGHILEICNLIRLYSYCIDHECYLHLYLKDNMEWKEFLKVLVKDTLQEIKSKDENDINIPSDYAENNFGFIESDRFIQKKKTKRKNEKEEDLSIFEFN
jgi:hypothetical protein